MSGEKMKFKHMDFLAATQEPLVMLMAAEVANAKVAEWLEAQKQKDAESLAALAAKEQVIKKLLAKLIDIESAHIDTIPSVLIAVAREGIVEYLYGDKYDK